MTLLAEVVRASNEVGATASRLGPWAAQRPAVEFAPGCARSGGLALRFARMKAYRPDKRPVEADTIDTVRRIHQDSLS